MNDKKYMYRCLALAQIGLSEAAPNPSVGALLVYNDKIIAEGYTAPFGGPHAEVNCINQISDESLLQKSTLYVSLEPCNHFGKTPPCAHLIIKKKIPKVVVACSDPNPKVAGRGIEALRKAGITVIEHVLENEAKELNKRFFTFHTKKRPYITLKWAQTKTNLFAPKNNSQFWISTKKTKALVHSWRSKEMAILVGQNTLIADNPRLNVRLVAGRNPIRIVINTTQRLPSNRIIFNDKQATILFTFFDYSLDTKHVKVVPLNEDESVVTQLCNYLYNAKINSLFVEGGAYTLQSFINEDKWDEARKIIGSRFLEYGIPAPQIYGEIKQEYRISTDNIQVIKPKFS